MAGKRLFLLISSVVLVLAVATTFADCPSADLTGDCFVDFEDFSVIGANWLNGYDYNDVNTLASQWLTTDPCVPGDMAYIPDGAFQMGDSFEEGWLDELPVHTVTIHSFYMSTCEITNAQYCDFLNSAAVKVISGIVYASSDDSNSYPYCDTHDYDSDSQIDYAGGVFTVRSKSGRDMSNDPMVEVSWYGAVAYCNWRSNQEGRQQCYNLSTWECDFSKHGYRLATEAEWEYAARGGLSGKRFPWGDTISHTQANYYSSSCSYDISPTRGDHPLWNDGIWPYTSPVGFFDGSLRHKSNFNWSASQSSYQTTSGANGYGLYDMAGNVWEWCHDWCSSTYYSTTPYPHVNPTGPTSGTWRVLRGGYWHIGANYCRVAYRNYHYPYGRGSGRGFRVVLDF